MTDIADAWEVFSQREMERVERTRMSRFCGECSWVIPVPEHVGDTDWGVCRRNDTFVYRGTSTAESECEDWTSQWV